jgi:hypothetical protein
MLCHGLMTLDELDTVKEKEKQDAEELKRARQEVNTLAPTVDEPLDPDLAAALTTYDPSDPFWVTLDFGDKIPRVIPGT